jgi:hypothetical protein
VFPGRPSGSGGLFDTFSHAPRLAGFCS